MAISRVGSGSVQANTITIPTHQAGDLIIISANRNNTTAPTVPSGWVIVNNTGLSGASTSLAWKLAKTTTETSGTWTNASAMHVAVYRADTGILAVSTSLGAGSVSGTTVPYNGQANGLVYRTGLLDNWYFATAFQLNSANSLETAPSGMSNINVESSAGVWKSVIHDTNASQLSNWSNTNVTVANIATGQTRVIQIFEFDGPDFGGGGGFRPVNIRGGADQ
jgi:hypothetical protein